MSLNANSPLGKILTKLLDLVILQLLFLVTSIPVFTIGAGLSAMFAVCRKLRQEDVVPVTKTYFREFKACFGKATAAWVILAAPSPAGAACLRCRPAGDFHQLLLPCRTGAADCPAGNRRSTAGAGLAGVCVCVSSDCLV